MVLQQRLDLLEQLGTYLLSEDEYLQATMGRTYRHNPWFTIENQELAIQAIATQFLDRRKLENWLTNYDLSEQTKSEKVGIVMAGNIPLAGFHDFICVFVTGHHALVKLSEKDLYLFPALLRKMKQINPEVEKYITLAAKLKGFDAVIATGSNRSSRYFEAYFGKYPNIIHKKRTAVAVLNGEESRDDLHALGKDVFRYFGLGSRNVSKLYVPEDYNFEPLLKRLHDYRQIVNHTKYKNNFDYKYSILILNRASYLANGCIILTEDQSLYSPIANLHYEYYSDKNVLESELNTQQEQIQVIVSNLEFGNLPTTTFGQAQNPGLSDYADGIDTMSFLLSL